MRYRSLAFLATTFLVVASHAATVNYIVSKETNGFDVFEVTKDAVTLVPGSPFGNNLIEYVWTDLNYIYVVNYVPTTYPNAVPAKVITYTMSSGEPKAVASLTDAEIGNPYPACGTCSTTIHGMFASPQHLFMEVIRFSQGSDDNFVHMYHTHPNGSLTFMCDMHFPISPYSDFVSSITSIRVDSNEIYAYINYTDPTTLVPETAIYDISVDACKQVGVVSQ